MRDTPGQHGAVPGLAQAEPRTCRRWRDMARGSNRSTSLCTAAQSQPCHPCPPIPYPLRSAGRRVHTATCEDAVWVPPHSLRREEVTVGAKEYLKWLPPGVLQVACCAAPHV